MNRKDLSTCPLCKAEKRRILFPVKTGPLRYAIVQCPRCELAQTFPLPTDEELDIHDFYEYFGKRSNKFVPAIQKIREWLMNKRALDYLSLLPTAKCMPNVLDIGCAEGRLLKAFLNKGCSCFGIEHKNYPESRFLCSDQIVYFKGGLENAKFPEESFELIFIWHVLEHLDRPEDVLNMTYDLLKKNGRIVIAVPNFSSLEATVFKDKWFHLDILWHKYHFTQNSMNYLIEKNNLRIVKSTTFCLEQGVYGLIQSILNSMGWPKNEFYEFIKGNISHDRTWAVLVQFFIVLWLLVPCFMLTSLTSWKGKGAILGMVLSKDSREKYQ